MVRCMLIGKGELGMSKIDTQGMSMPIDPSDPKYKKTWNMQPHKPMMKCMMMMTVMRINYE